MKKRIIILGILVSSTVFVSCKKFLEESSQDLVRPITAEHYKELLQGEAYFKEFYKYGWFVDIMTDDINLRKLGYETTNLNTKAEYVKYAYQWGNNLEDPRGTFIDRLFKLLYKNILIANSCLENMEVMEGTAEEKKVVKGQALFTRAYGYFVLANLYAQDYSLAQPRDLCVPIIENTTPSMQRYNRNTIGEVWTLIKNDAMEAVELLKDDKVARSAYEINYRTALILASRVSLFMKDYVKVISYGEQYLLLSSVLKDITQITTSPTTTGAYAGNGFLLLSSNPEIALSFGVVTSSTAEGTYAYYSSESTGISPNTFTASYDVPNALIDLYTANDKRKINWFAQPTGVPGAIFAKEAYTPLKVQYYDLARTTQYMRTGEVYLNLAEAYVKKANPETNKALDLLNQLRSKRIAGYTNKLASDFSSTDDLYQFVLEERRRELCFEEFHRWWDLRRTGQPSLVHIWDTETYVLAEKDPAYILNFPTEELEFNPDLVQNPRPVRNPQ